MVRGDEGSREKGVGTSIVFGVEVRMHADCGEGREDAAGGW